MFAKNNLSLGVARSLVGLAAIAFAANAALLAAEPANKKVFRAGVFAMDITPLELPVIVNGGMTEATADKINDRLHARCFVLDDGSTKLAIVVVDSCMIPRNLLDEAKDLAQQATGIPSNHILISSTHTHSAPSSFAALGSDADPKYIRFLPTQIAKGIDQANKNLQLFLKRHPDQSCLLHYLTEKR